MRRPRSVDTAHLAAACLDEIAAVRDARDLAPEEVALRLAQYAACARGDACPEVAFHPVARALWSVARAVSARPAARASWEARVREAVAGRAANDDGHPRGSRPSR